METIFQHGISTCDSVLVYLTENSIASQMVKKEIDASLIQQLDDNKTSFLPYVSEDKLRSQLRPDIRALQVPVWSNDNYSEILPCVVAEIWHSYLERTVGVATSEEKIKRLELELQIEKNKDGEIFTSSENKDFSYIKRALDYDELTGYDIKNKKTNVVESIKINVNILSLIPFISRPENRCYDFRTIYDRLVEYFRHEKVIPALDNNLTISRLATIKITGKLITYGLIEARESPSPRRVSSVMIKLNSPQYVYTAKVHRFKYWLRYNDFYPTKIKYSVDAPPPHQR